MLGIFVLAPVAMMLVYSFLTKEFRGGVIWEFSLAAYDQFFCDRGPLRRRTLRDRMDLYHHLLALDLAGRSGDAAEPADRLSHRLFHRHTARTKVRPIWVFLITIPYWVNLLIRTVDEIPAPRQQGPLNDFLLIDRPDRQPSTS